MLFIELADGTRIDNCSDYSTIYQIIVIRSSYAEAGGVFDIITPEKARSIKIYGSDETLITERTNLVLNDDAILKSGDGKYMLVFGTRDKTEMELMHDEISELQEAVIDIAQEV